MILLDSHVLLWVLSGSPRLGSRARKTLTEADTVFASAATVWELAIKSMLGRLELPDDFVSKIEAQGIRMLDVSARHGLAIRSFPEIARHDPFDRLLVAQAQCDGLPLLTCDRVLLELGRRFILDAEQ